MIKTLSVKKYGKNYKISDHFTLGEFQCKDGSDTVKYSTELLAMLEKLRSYGNFTISINSGYRTPAYNQKIGGASKSKHTEGYAADIMVKQNGKTVNAKLVCCLCQTLGFKGIGYISANATHLDMRPSGTYRGDERSGYGNNVTDFYRYFNVSTCDIAELKASQEPVKPDEKQEEEIMYKTINDVPSYYKAAVQKLIDRKLLQGTGNGEINVTDDFCRTMTVLDRAGIFDGKSATAGTNQEIADALVKIAQSYKGE